MTTPNDENDRLRAENTQLRDERRAHNQDWQDTVMKEFGEVKAQISGLRNAINGGMEPENGIQYRIRELERDVELRNLQEAAAQKKIDRSLLVWPPLLLLIAERLWSFFSNKH